LGTGGSDAHLASHLGACLTDFPTDDITCEADIVQALKAGNFRAVRIEETA